MTYLILGGIIGFLSGIIFTIGAIFVLVEYEEKKEK